jgi:hypothetical protein
MKTAIIIHGIGGHAGIHWQQWLHDELVERDFKVLMPDLPNPDHPDRKTWLAEISKALDGTDLNQLVIVGHSLGVTTALDFIEQADGPIDGLVSVSGFAEDYGADLNSYFLSQKTINFDKVKTKLNWSAVLYGDDDPYVPQTVLRQVAEALGVQATVIPKGGHLNTEAGFTEFPLLLEIIK